MRFSIKTTYFLLACILVAFSGCANLQGLMTLKRVGDSQNEIERHLTKQLELFNRLVRDVKEEKLRQGVSKAQFIKTYGDPVITRQEGSLPQQEILLYRHPTECFTSDRVYVYFDETKKLVRWEYQPYQKSE